MKYLVTVAGYDALYPLSK